MYTPLLMSALTLAVSAHGTADRRPDIHRVRHGVAVAAAATGLAGTGFHIYNVLKRPGRLSWQNLFYGAPLGAPMAILLSGLLGIRRRMGARHAGRKPPRVFGCPLGARSAALSGLGLLGTTAEAALLHFRGAFQNPAMFLPVTIPPVGAALLLNAAVAPKRRDRWFARVWLRLTPAAGLAGVGFHAWGVAPQHGRLAQLAPERAERPAAAGAAQLHRPGAGRARRARPAARTTRMPERYPGYDVLAKRNTPSWNEQTRRVIDRRLAVPREPRFFSEDEFATVEAIAARIVPQPAQPRRRFRWRRWWTTSCCDDSQDGYRDAGMPRAARSLAARPAGAGCRGRGGARRDLPRARRQRSRTRCCSGCSRASCSTRPGAACRRLVLQAAPAARHRAGLLVASDGLERNRLGRAGQPARLCAHGLRRARPVGGGRGASDGDADDARTERTAMSDDPLASRAARTAGRRMCSAPAAGCRCGIYREDEAVDFAIVGTGAGGGTLACRLAEAGFSVVGSRCRAVVPAAGGFRLRRSRADEALLDRRPHLDGDNPLQLGSNNSGKAVGGSTVHFAMVSLRFRPEWFSARTLLGYGADWPIDWREMWRYYAEVEQALKIAGPVSYPWGPKRPRYPYRAHELNAAALALAEGCEALGIDWTRDAAGDAVGAARAGASLRLSRLLRHRLLHQRQAERAGHLDSARRRGRRGNPRPGDGRPRRGRRRRTAPPACTTTARGAGGSSRPAMSWSPATRSRRRGCC